MSRVLTGVVVSNKMDKSVVVSMESYKTHPIYKKRYKVTKRIKAHDEKNICKVGDMVEISETRPISKSKTFNVTNILTKKGGKQ